MPKQQIRPLRLLTNCLVGGLLTLVVAAAGLLVTLYLALSPRLTAQKEMETLAGQDAGLTDLRDFATFNGQDTYYSIIGTDSEQQETLLLLKENDDQAELINLSKMIDKEQLTALLEKENLTPERISFGRYKNKLVWEVKSQLRYYLFNAETGELMTVWG